MTRFLVPFPDAEYYHWQVLVHWLWMRRHGLPVTYVGYTGRTGPVSAGLARMMERSGADIHVWNDWRTRAGSGYGPAMKPGLVGRWLEAHPEEVGEVLVVCDPDALPLPALMESLASGVGVREDRWVGTDVTAYAGPGYLIGKGEDLWAGLVRLVLDRTPGVTGLRAGEDWPGIGAQVAVTGRGHEWWDTVARVSTLAHRLLTAHRSDVQTWCAEMYVTQLMMARDGIEPVPDPGWGMVWANGDPGRWETAGWFHNAGVPAPNGRDFCKIEYQTAPFGRDLVVDPASASARYVDLVRAVPDEFPWAVA